MGLYYLGFYSKHKSFYRLVSSFLSNLYYKSDIMIKKKGNKILTLTYIITFLFLLFFASSMGAVLNNSKIGSSKEIINYENNLKNLKNSGYWPLSNISINDIAWNNWAWAATKDWCSGAGTLGDPYIIENVTIKNSNKGIYIRDSIKYFVIRNVTVYNVTTASGIILNNVTNGVLFDNNISSNNFWGIYLTGSKYNLISENFIFNNTNDGILLRLSSNNNTVETNIILNNQINGIFIKEISNNNTIIGNIVHNNTQNGISLNSGNNNTIIGNTVYNNTQSGIFLDSSDNNTINDNIIKLNENYGIELFASNYIHIKENFIYKSSSHGIELMSSSNNNTIEANTVIGNGQGIDLSDSDGNVIIDNMVSGSFYAGIGIANADFTQVIGNIIYNNTQQGIYIDVIRNSTISENVVYNNTKQGIYIYSGNFTNVIGNIVYNNTQQGIFMDSIYNSVITENIVYKNLLSGIQLDEENINNNVTKNIIRDNKLNGLLISSITNDTLIWKNVFIRNGKHAVDSGSNNNWNITTIGNYWDNWTSPDVSPNDGIVDVPYNISGSAGSVDYLPIAEDGAPRITINSPSGGDAFSSTAPSFDVTITDDYLDDMWYSIDEGLNNYTFTANGIIEQAAWSPISDGDLTLIFYARDIPGNIGTAEVIIAKDTQLPTISINSPSPGDKFGVNAPSFIVTVIEDHVETLWYTMDGGLNNYTFTANGTIYQTAWNAMSDGTITLEFYVNDTLGYLGTDEVIIEKDSQAPIIIINSPNNGEVFGNDAPSFSVTVTDPNLDSVWLELDGSIYELSIPIIGTINQTAWAALPQGDYTITFYANDTLGHSTSEAITITKSVPSGGGIGLDYVVTSFLIFITGGIGVIVVIVKIRTKKRVKYS